MWKNIVHPGRPQMTIWRMRIICWIRKATNTHSEYVIPTAFPLQQQLHERASMLRCTLIACFVLKYFGFLLSLLVQPPPLYSDRDNSVRIATRYGLDSPGIESRCGARFSVPVQNGPGAHPVSYSMGTGYLSRG